MARSSLTKRKSGPGFINTALTGLINTYVYVYVYVYVQTALIFAVKVSQLMWQPAAGFQQ